MTLEFRQAGHGTEFVFLQEQFHDQAARDGHASGWAGAFAKLDRTLASD